RLGGNGVDARFQHGFRIHAWNQIHPFWYDGTWHQGTNNPHVPLVSGSREGDYGPSDDQVAYKIRLNTHGHKYNVSYHFIDNAGNTSNDYVSTGKYIGVDGNAPTIGFRNTADTSNFTSRGWSSEEIRVRLKHHDPHSGYKRSRYQWTQ